MSNLSSDLIPESVLKDMLFQEERRNQKMRIDWRPDIGERVLITGNHPHSGKSGTVYAHDDYVFGKPTIAMAVRCDDGSNAGIQKVEHFKVLTNDQT